MRFFAFCAGLSTAFALVSLATGHYGLAALNAMLVAANALGAVDLNCLAQRHSDSAHGVCDSEATEVAKNASAAVRPSTAPLRGNGDFSEEER